MAATIPQYSIGDTLITSGEKIVHICGQTETCGVFLVAGERIKVEYYPSKDIPKRVHLANVLMGDLSTRIKATIVKKRQDLLIAQLGAAIFSAVDSGDKNIAPYFATLSEQVAFRSAANQSYRYIIGSLIAVIITTLLSFALWKLTNTLPTILIGITGGAFGALISVLQRIANLGLSKFAPLWYAFFQGTARTGLGVLFGGFFVLANQGDIAMSAYKSNLWAVAVFAVLAGLSERFVPELIRRMEVHKPETPKGS